MQEPIFLKAYLEEKIWGGQKLRSQFSLDIPSDQTGEAWVISGHEHGQSIVTSPESQSGVTVAVVLSSTDQKESAALLALVGEVVVLDPIEEVKE